MSTLTVYKNIKRVEYLTSSLPTLFDRVWCVDCVPPQSCVKVQQSEDHALRQVCESVETHCCFLSKTSEDRFGFEI